MLFDAKRIVGGTLPYNLRRIHMYDQLQYSPDISGLFRNLLKSHLFFFNSLMESEWQASLGRF
jgi:hypothetical protein